MDWFMSTGPGKSVSVGDFSGVKELFARIGMQDGIYRLSDPAILPNVDTRTACLQNDTYNVFADSYGSRFSIFGRRRSVWWIHKW
jgi:hypothetical protein